MLTFPAPRFPLDWLEKLFAVLVLLEVCAERVVVGLKNEEAQSRFGRASRINVTENIRRRISPQESGLKLGQVACPLISLGFWELSQRMSEGHETVGYFWSGGTCTLVTCHPRHRPQISLVFWLVIKMGSPPERNYSQHPHTNFHPTCADSGLFFGEVSYYSQTGSEQGSYRVFNNFSDRVMWLPGAEERADRRWNRHRQSPIDQPHHLHGAGKPVVRHLLRTIAWLLGCKRVSGATIRRTSRERFQSDVRRYGLRSSLSSCDRMYGKPQSFMG